MSFNFFQKLQFSHSHTRLSLHVLIGMLNGLDYHNLGKYTRTIYVTSYSPPHQIQFMYEDLSQVAVTIKLSQDTPERCVMDYNAGTRRTSYLYHVCLLLFILASVQVCC